MSMATEELPYYLEDADTWAECMAAHDEADPVWHINVYEVDRCFRRARRRRVVVCHGYSRCVGHGTGGKRK